MRYYFTIGLTTHAFQLTPVSHGIFAVQFFDGLTHIAPPKGFRVFNGATEIKPVFNSYFVVWFSDYTLLHGDILVASLNCKRAHEVQMH